MSFTSVILREWATRVHNGSPNIESEQHLRELVHVLVEYDQSASFIHEFVSNLMEDKPLDKELTWKDKKSGERKTGTARSVIQGGDDDHPAWNKAKSLQSKENSEKESDAEDEKDRNKKDAEKEKEKKAKKEKKDEEEKEDGSSVNIPLTPGEKEAMSKASSASPSPEKIMSDFNNRGVKLKNATPERQELLNKNLNVIQNILDPNTPDNTKMELLNTIKWSISSGSGNRKFYLKDLYDKQRSDKILGDSGNKSTEDLVKAVVALHKRTGTELPTELSSRQMGDFGKIEATKLDPISLSNNSAYKGDTTQRLESALGRFEGNERKKLENSIKVQRDLGHTESVAVDLDVYLDNPTDYQQKMGNVTVDIIKDSRNSMIDRFGKQLKPENIQFLDDKISEMEQAYKTNNVSPEYLGKWYADVKENISQSNPQLAEAYANNLGEMFAIQDEVLNGHYVVIPTAKNAKLGDKVRLMTRDGATDPAMVKVLTDLMGSVKKEAKTTVGAQHTHVGILEGCDYGTEEDKINIISSAHAAKYMNVDENGVLNVGGLKSFLKGSKDLKDLSSIKKLVNNMGLDASLMDSKEGIDSIVKSWSDGMEDETFRRKFNKAIAINAGLTSPKTKQDTETFTTYLKDNNITLDGYVSTMVGNTDPKNGKVSANGKTVKNALSAMISGNTDTLDSKELQILTSLVGIPQKTKENFGYDVVDASGPEWKTTYNYAQQDGETIHANNNSYIMGYLKAYDMNPRYGKGGKAYNVGKRSISQMKRKQQAVEDLASMA
jgi:hypothetical protein